MYISNVDFLEIYKKKTFSYFNDFLNEVEFSELLYFISLYELLSRNINELYFTNSDKHTYEQLLKELNENVDNNLVELYNKYLEILKEQNLLTKIERKSFRIIKTKQLIKIFLDAIKDLQRSYNNSYNNSNENENFKREVERRLSYMRDALKELDNLDKKLRESEDLLNEIDENLSDKIDQKVEEIVNDVSKYGPVMYGYQKLKLEYLEALIDAFKIGYKLFKYVSGLEKTIEAFDIRKSSSYSDTKILDTGRLLFYNVSIKDLFRSKSFKEFINKLDLLLHKKEFKTLKAVKIANKDYLVKKYRVEEIKPYYIVLVDFSGSMNDKTRYIIANSLVIALTLKSKGKITVMTFSDTVDKIMSNKDEIVDFLLNHIPRSGGTSYYNAVLKAIEIARKLKDEKKYKDIRLIVIGDLMDYTEVEKLTEVMKELFMKVIAVSVVQRQRDNQTLYDYFKENFELYEITNLKELVEKCIKVMI